MKKAVFLLMLFIFLGLVISLIGCAVYPSPGCNNNEILATKAMAARALILEMEKREPVNWHCVPGYTQGPVASTTATAAKAAPSVIQGTGDYIVDISSDGNSLLVAVDARLIRQPGPGEKMYFVGNFSDWRPAQGNEMTINSSTNCWETTIPLMAPGDYQGNATLQIAGTDLKRADSFWAAVQKSSSKWVKINPSTQKGSINFRICANGNVEPGPGI